MIINHIGCSGGKDSTALLLWAVRESGYDPNTINATFCDTGNEHPLTYDYIRMLSEKIHPIQWLKPRLLFYDLVRERGMWPRVRQRFCTEELKIIPSKNHIKLLQSYGFHVVAHSGVRASESIERSRLMQREDINTMLTEFRPLLHWTINDVWDLHRKHGIEPNPLYKMGAVRVGCYPCIMSRKSEMAKVSEYYPEQIGRIREMENEFESAGMFRGFFHPRKTPTRFHSRKIRKSDGTFTTACTVDDVVAWAKDGELETSGKELKTSSEDGSVCQSFWGACE